MMRRLLCSRLALALTCGMRAQKSQTAEQMERMGYVNVTSVDSTIRVSLMYARPDNFTGKTLYTDLLEAYLHPTAAKALARAQSLLRQRRSDL